MVQLQVDYPNRDSTVYGKEYGIEECKTLLRGTLRYEGFVEALTGLKELGLLCQEQHPALQPGQGPEMSWVSCGMILGNLYRFQKEFIAMQLNQRPDIFPESLRKLAAEQMTEGERSVQFRALESLGLFSDSTPLIKRGTPMDCLVALLETSLA